MKAIIIDDEPQSHEILQDMLSNNHSEVEVIATGDCVKKGYELIKKYLHSLLK